MSRPGKKFFWVILCAMLIAAPVWGEDDGCSTEAIIVGSQIEGSTLSVTVTNPTTQTLNLYIFGTVEYGGQLEFFYAPITQAPLSTETWGIGFPEHLNVLSGLGLSECIPDAPVEGVDPIAREADKKKKNKKGEE